MPRRRCLSCGRMFNPRPQIPNQTYCSDAACQQLRRRLWQRQKRIEDPAYRENEALAHRQWLDRNKDYWRRYRLSHPEYADRNRQQQRARDDKRSNAESLANKYVSMAGMTIADGLYRLVRLDGGVANKDEWVVRITPMVAKSQRRRS